MKKDFFASVIQAAGIEKNAPVVVLCGGPYDRRVLLDCGLTNVLVTNLEHHAKIEVPYELYRWMRQDAEQLTFDDNFFDWAVVHAGLHHCGSPHKALCEMLRVARRGIVVVEARDSILVRLAAKIGITQDFELAPMALSLKTPDGAFGGLRATFIPNYIYRWKEREVVKTVNSYLPQYVHAFRFFYGLRLPVQAMTMSKSVMLRTVVTMLDAVAWVFELLVPRQGNLFGFVVTKRDAVRPWLIEDKDELKINEAYLLSKYSPEKYRKGTPVN